METKLKSLLDEISNYAPQQNVDQILEMRVGQIVASAQHLFKLIEENYDADTAEDLSRRLLNSIRTGDENKFRRKIVQVRESRAKGKKS